MANLIIVGAGTLGEIVVETATRAGLEVDGFMDDYCDTDTFLGLPVLGRVVDFGPGDSSWGKGVFVAIGNNVKRRNCVNFLKQKGQLRFPTVVDPRATVYASSSLGEGNLILPNAVIGANCKVGSWNIFFSGVTIGHHNNLGNFSFFAPNCSVGGYAQIADSCKFGMNSVVRPHSQVSEDTVCGPLSIVGREYC